MDLDHLIVTVFCQIDDALTDMTTCSVNPYPKQRQRGPSPSLADSEVLTIEILGAFLGLHQDKQIFLYFRQHYRHFFPALGHLHRTTFTRQAANLWQTKERLWHRIAQKIPHDPHLSIIDSFPLPVCRFARAPRCRRFRGSETAPAFGKDTVARQTFFGFRVHVRLAWPGVLSTFCLAPGNVQETAVAPELSQGFIGTLWGDRNYWSPHLKAELARQGACLVAPFKSRKTDPNPEASHLFSRFRYRIDTVFGQLCGRFGVKQVWARNAWHLWSRLLRVFLAHTVLININQATGNELLQLDKLIAT